MKLFIWADVRALRADYDGTVTAMAETKEQAIETAVAAVKDIRPPLAKKLIPEIQLSLREELNRRKPTMVKDGPFADLVLNGGRD